MGKAIQQGLYDLHLMLDTLEKGLTFLKRQGLAFDNSNDDYIDHYIPTLLLINEAEKQDYFEIRDQIDVLEAQDLL